MVKEKEEDLEVKETSTDASETEDVGRPVEPDGGLGRTRRRNNSLDKAEANPTALYKASELASKAVEIADVRGYIALGALSHANVKGDDKISVEQFKKICKEFSNAKAF